MHCYFLAVERAVGLELGFSSSDYYFLVEQNIVVSNDDAQGNQ